MKVCCISDLHGYLPEIPQCELLLIGGDICPVSNHAIEFQFEWLKTTFVKWLDYLPAEKIVLIAGNHDFVFEIDDLRAELTKILLPAVYLQDSGTEFKELSIYGSPWQPRFFDWAFNLDEWALKDKWDLIPTDTDILLLHGPPYGYGDLTRPYKDNPGQHTGSPSLTKRIIEVKPKLVVFGHIHSGAGKYKIEDSILVNAAYVDETYKPTYKPTIIEI